MFNKINHIKNTVLSNPEIRQAQKNFGIKWNKKIKKSEISEYRKDAKHLQDLIQLHI